MDVLGIQPLLPGGQIAYAMDDAIYPAVTGGMGSGKTFVFVRRSMREIGENRGVMDERHPGVLMEPTHPMTRDILLPELTHALDTYEIPWDYHKSEHRLMIDGFGHVLLLSAENYMRHVGLNIPFFGVDELDTINPNKARSMWNIMISRLRVNGSTGRGFVSGTPEGFGFLHEKWDNPEDKDYSLHRISSRDNHFLPKTFVPRLLKAYDAQLVKAYVDGLFVNLKGAQAAWAFDRAIHVKTFEGDNGEMWAGLDFNVGKMACVIAHEYSNDVIHYSDEICLRNSNTEEMAQELRARHPQLVNVFPDPAGKARSTTSTTSDHKILEKYGFRVYARKAHPTHRDRLNALNAKLKNAEGRVGMYVDPKCREFIADLEQVTRDKYGGIAKQDDERSHFLDAGSYPIEYKWSVAIARATMSKRY